MSQEPRPQTPPPSSPDRFPIAVALLALVIVSVWVIRSQMKREPEAPLASPAPAASQGPYAELANRLRERIRKDLTEKLQAKEITGIEVQDFEEQPDGGIQLSYKASYTQEGGSYGKVSRTVEGLLKLARENDDWRVVSSTPKSSTLIFEDGMLVEPAR